MRVSVCVGNYAEIPYCIPGLDMNVRSMEELCYCMKENAFLLDLSLMNDGLLKWIEQQCGLRRLVEQLYPLVHRKGSLSAFVVTIFQYVGLYENSVVQDVERVLKQGAGLSSIEKRKSQIDYLVKKKKYDLALKNYDALLKMWEEEAGSGEAMPAVSCLAAIWHNRGVAYTGLMRYEKAAECFLKAYELHGDESYVMAYLAAKRMALPEEAYVAFVAEHGELYQCSLQLEKQFESYEQEWEQQPEYLMLYHRSELKGTQRQKYYEENERVTLNLKESYRSCIIDR